MACLFNGHSVEEQEPYHDRGLHYGDGVFRTLAIYQGQVLDLAGQLAHLQADAQRLGIGIDVETLSSEAETLARAQNTAVLKIIITRGSGARGYRATPDLRPNRYLFTTVPPQGISAAQAHGIAVQMCQLRMGMNPVLAGIKHLNRLEQVMARRELTDTAHVEGLMLDGAGRLISGVQSNLFLVNDGKLYTPDLADCGVAGRMRARILALCDQLSITCTVSHLRSAQLQMADEVFLTNSLIGIWPVIRCQNVHWPVGALTRHLQANLNHPGIS